MNISSIQILLGLALTPLVFVGCGEDEDVLRFESQNKESSGPPDEESGSGGGGSKDEQSKAEDQGMGGASYAYRQGGYGGQGDVTWGIVDENGNHLVLDYTGVCNGVDPSTGENLHALSYWAPAECRAGSLCSSVCDTDADCESALAGPLPAVCESYPGVPSFKFCTLPCTSDSDCLDEMVCGTTDSGIKTCVLADTPWAPGCDNFCLDESTDTPQILCGRDADCCEGLSCSPSGQCQARECLPGSWSCEEGGAPCCDGLSCEGGYCTP